MLSATHRRSSKCRCVASRPDVRWQPVGRLAQYAPTSVLTHDRLFGPPRQHLQTNGMARPQYPRAAVTTCRRSACAVSSMVITLRVCRRDTRRRTTGAAICFQVGNGLFSTRRRRRSRPAAHVIVGRQGRGCTVRSSVVARRPKRGHWRLQRRRGWHGRQASSCPSLALLQSGAHNTRKP